jgi:cytochrome P450
MAMELFLTTPQLLKAQIKELARDPKSLDNLPHSTTIYHELLRPEAYRTGTAPSVESLYEESQALLFGGADTTGTTLMHGAFHILSSPKVYRKLKEELLTAWPDLNNQLTLLELEKLPYLTAVLKESLRISPGVASPLPRVVPAEGATICGTYVPGGTVVEMSSYFVHGNASIFKTPKQFDPDRWLGPEGKDLDKWLVAFSKGPRSCLGLKYVIGSVLVLVMADS